MSRKDWRWFGQPGHFVGAIDCSYHLHTHVNGYCVSTVGEYRPDYKRTGNTGMVDLGGRLSTDPHSYYETMVFRLGDDDRLADGSDLDGTRYETHEQADQGHLSFCRKAEKGTVGYAFD